MRIINFNEDIEPFHQRQTQNNILKSSPNTACYDHGSEVDQSRAKLSINHKKTLY